MQPEENPFASPGVTETSDTVEVREPDAPPRQIELASRRARLHATFLDGLFLSPFSMIVGGSIHSAGIEIGIPSHTIGESVLTRILFGGLMIFPFLQLNGYLLVTQGQTFGKWLCRIAILRHNDTHPPFYDLVWLRYLPFFVCVCVPVLNVLCLIDLLWMFVSKDRRCLHDYFAGTIVVNASTYYYGEP